MASKGNDGYRARRRQRERQRRQVETRAAGRGAGEPATALTSGAARRAAATTCGWCTGRITPRTSGPIPKWCSATCRKQAWEQKRAAASGRAAVEIVERVVTPPPPPTRTLASRREYWLGVLTELSRQLDRGDVYDRDLPAVAAALREALTSFERRIRQG